MRSRTHALARHAHPRAACSVQRAQFIDFTAPVDDRTLARFYTFSDTDLELIRCHRRDSTQLGFAVQLGYAGLPGRVLRVGEEVHPQIVATLASQLGVDPGTFAALLIACELSVALHARYFLFSPFSP